jgi:hypothetical protein
MIIACIYVRPGTNYVGHGVLFEALTKNPLDLRSGNVLGYRVLTPWICWAIGLRGRIFIIFNLIVACFSIGLVYCYFRRRVQQPGDALFAAGGLTFSAVILVTIYYAGFCDAMTYLLLFLMWQYRRKPWAFYPLFFAGILNHEGILFLVPWWLYIFFRESTHRRRLLLEIPVGFGLVLTLFFLFRHWLSQGKEVGMTSVFYFGALINDPLLSIRNAFQFYWMGFFSVFKGLWIFVIAAAVSLWKGGEKPQVIGMVLLMACAACQLLVAIDSTRMFTLGFLVLIISLEHLYRTNAYDFRRWAIPVFVFNLFIPQMLTAGRYIEIMHSLPSNILRMIFEHAPYWKAGG